MIDACAGLDGVIGVNGIGAFLPGGEAEAEAMVRVIDYLAERVGIRHIGIGLDYVYDIDLDYLPEGEDPAYWFPRSSATARASTRPSFRIAGGGRRPGRAAGGARLRRRRHRGRHGRNFLRVAERCWSRPG